MQINQGIWANWPDNHTEVNQNKISQHRESNCLNLKSVTNQRTYRQTDLCIELRYAQLNIQTAIMG